MDPRNEQGLLFKARILQREKSSLKALEAYKELHEKFPENLEANGRIGQISTIKDYFQAKNSFSLHWRLMRITDRRRLIGLCIERLGETSEALSYLCRSRRADYVKLGEGDNLYLKMNKEQKARDVVESAYLKIDDQILVNCNEILPIKKYLLGGGLPKCD